MSIGTCGTCKYKGEPITKTDYDTFEDVDTGYFTCDLIKHNDTYEDEGKYNLGQAAFVVDGSGYYAALCVEDDFGCVKWKDSSLNSDG